MSAVVIGPLVGGVLTEFFGWRVVYLMNIPLGITALVMMHTLVPTDKPEGSKPFDMFGFIVLGICIAAFQLMLDNGQNLTGLIPQKLCSIQLLPQGHSGYSTSIASHHEMLTSIQLSLKTGTL